jgi:hypothetical protein
MEFERLQQITRESRAGGVRNSLLLFLNGPSYVRELLDHLDQVVQRLTREKELLRADTIALEGRISVATEAAAREGWRQAIGRPAGAADVVLDLEAVRTAAAKAKPRAVHGEAVLRAGIPEGVTVTLAGGGTP